MERVGVTPYLFPGRQVPATDDRQLDSPVHGRIGRAVRLGMVERTVPRILVVAPQPFYQDRGTPIALRQVLQALSESGRGVDLVTYPVGEDVAMRGLRIIR